MGVILTTYKSWDDPPSRLSRHQKLQHTPHDEPFKRYRFTIQISLGSFCRALGEVPRLSCLGFSRHCVARRVRCSIWELRTSKHHHHHHHVWWCWPFFSMTRVAPRFYPPWNQQQKPKAELKIGRIPKEISSSNHWFPTNSVCVYLFVKFPAQ